MVVDMLFNREVKTSHLNLFKKYFFLWGFIGWIKGYYNSIHMLDFLKLSIFI